MLPSCVLPPELTAEQLHAYVDGESDADVNTHIKRCSYCRSRARRLADFQTQLVGRLYRVDCPPSLDLELYELGHLSPQRRAELAAHIQRCPYCAQDVAEIEAPPGWSTTRRSDSLAAMVHKMAELVSHWKPPALFPASAPALAGIRGQPENERYLFRVEDGIEIAIEVLVEPHRPDARTVMGLVSGVGEKGWTITALQDSEPRHSAVDELGNFSLSNLGPGSCALRLSGPNTEIDFPPIAL